jgi:tRNA uridine 5-carbamoylmethylation protein Kti12
MPLIIICGQPCTGKSSFALQLKQHLLDNGSEQVVLVNEEALRLNRQHAYSSSSNEKDLRSVIKSAVDHALSPTSFVIADSLNYIKGYRYELYCSARSLRSPHCVVWVAASELTSSSWNEQRSARGEDAYDPEVMKELRKRFEAPNASNRWDCPLFKVSSAPTESVAVIDHSVTTRLATVSTEKPKSSWRPKKASAVPVDAPSPSPALGRGVQDAVWFSGSAADNLEDLSCFSDVPSALQGISARLSSAPLPAPSCSTITPLHAQANLLYELDRTSASITQQLVAHQAESGEGVALRLPIYDRALALHRHASVAELQRLRRQWVKINAQHPPSSIEAIGASFVDFLAVHL